MKLWPLVRVTMAIIACALIPLGAMDGLAYAANADAGLFGRTVGGAHDASAASDAASAAGAGAWDLERARLERTASRVGDLVAGHLDSAIAPATLFDIPINDNHAVDLEAARLRLFLADLDAGDSVVAEPQHVERAYESIDMRDGAAEDVPAAVIAARLELDRARLIFYRLPEAQRRHVLAGHKAEQLDASIPSEADQRAAEAERQRQIALRAAGDARTEAQRLVATEYARLLAVEGAQAKLDTSMQKARREIGARREATLGWQRHAGEALAGSSYDFADSTYDDLRRALRSARDEFSDALDDLDSGANDVPVAGPDALSNLEIDIDTTEVRAERARVDAEARRLRNEETKLHEDRASQLLDEIDTLNHERLALLGALSPSKRSAVTGFTRAGLDQATSELRQLTLILRYHRYVVTRWITSLRHPDRELGRAIAGGAIGLVEWLVAIGIFLWWRRRANAVLLALRLRARAADRHARLPEPSLGTRTLSFALQVHGPIEWLALLLALTWLLPASTQAILEVRVASAIATWTIGAALIIASINALATSTGTSATTPEIDTAPLRLRSLRLVGRTVVAFGLVLVISSMVVGRGTIYQWVFSTCWLASVPIFLILIRWWRDVVFRRTDLLRKKTPFQSWVLANRVGWKSFLAVTLGAAHLFATGSIRTARNWVGRFDITRKFLAYLFRRELTKLGSELPPSASGPIPDESFRMLGPGTPSEKWIASDLDVKLESFATRLRERRGGVVAIVGERGLGKTSALRRIATTEAASLFLDAPTTGLSDLRAKLASELGLDPDTTLDAAAQALDASPNLHGIFIDNLHRFVQPIVGGLAPFDELLEIASRHSTKTTWIVSLDDIIWQFLDRSRGARPLFDDVIHISPWREEEIVALLRARTEQAGLTPSFESLLDRLPPNADEIDKQEATEHRSADYFRLLWDYAIGNPSVALHMWRRSLGVDPSGATHVRLFTVMDTSDFERLPDRAVFVLRAVLQLAPARPAQIALATMLAPSEIQDALRYAAARDYIEEWRGGYRVTWTWFRAVTLFLQRRHLLVIR